MTNIYVVLPRFAPIRFVKFTASCMIGLVVMLFSLAVKLICLQVFLSTLVWQGGCTSLLCKCLVTQACGIKLAFAMCLLQCLHCTDEAHIGRNRGSPVCSLIGLGSCFAWVGGKGAYHQQYTFCIVYQRRLLLISSLLMVLYTEISDQTFLYIFSSRVWSIKSFVRMRVKNCRSYTQFCSIHSAGMVTGTVCMVVDENCRNAQN